MWVYLTRDHKVTSMKQIPVYWIIIYYLCFTIKDNHWQRLEHDIYIVCTWFCISHICIYKIWRLLLCLTWLSQFSFCCWWTCWMTYSYDEALKFFFFLLVMARDSLVNNLWLNTCFCKLNNVTMSKRNNQEILLEISWNNLLDQFKMK